MTEPWCEDGLVRVWWGDDWEWFACLGCPGCEGTS